MDKNGIKYVFCLLSALFSVGHSVRIINLRVPSFYVLPDATNANLATSATTSDLVLDCEYVLDTADRGFVLKWLLNDQLVYQWIPTKKNPQALSVLRHNINTNHTVSGHQMHAHRAVAIVRPTLNMTGTYTCSVSSFKSEDRRSAHMQMVRRETRLRVQMTENTEDRTKWRTRCTASGVFPEPQLTMYIDDVAITGFTHSAKLNESDGLYDAVTSGNLAMSAVTAPESVHCVLRIAGTNYTSRAETDGFSGSGRMGMSRIALWTSVLLATTMARPWQHVRRIAACSIRM